MPVGFSFSCLSFKSIYIYKVFLKKNKKKPFALCISPNLFSKHNTFTEPHIFDVPGCHVSFHTKLSKAAQCLGLDFIKNWLWIGVLLLSLSFTPNWPESSERGAAGRRWPSPTDKLICIRSLGLKWRKWYEGRAAERNKERQSGSADWWHSNQTFSWRKRPFTPTLQHCGIMH